MPRDLVVSGRDADDVEITVAVQIRDLQILRATRRVAEDYRPPEGAVPVACVPGDLAGVPRRDHVGAAVAVEVAHRHRVDPTHGLVEELGSLQRAAAVLPVANPREFGPDEQVGVAVAVEISGSQVVGQVVRAVVEAQDGHATKTAGPVVLEQLIVPGLIGDEQIEVAVVVHVPENSRDLAPKETQISCIRDVREAAAIIAVETAGPA